MRRFENVVFMYTKTSEKVAKRITYPPTEGIGNITGGGGTL